MEKRTLKQNNSLHKFFEILSTELNTKGLDARIVLKPTYSIWWTPEMIKRDLWKPMQKAMFNKESTTELSTAEVSKVYEQIAHVIGEKFGVEIDFPSEQQTEEYISSFKD